MLKCSNLFNTLDARGAISVTERVGVIQRVRKLAVGVAQAWADQQQEADGGGGAMSLPFLLEIGTEEIPDWMIPGALENLRVLFEKLEIPHDSVTLDATPRRLVLRAEGLPERQADSEERVLGPAKSAPAAGRGRLRAQAGREAGRPGGRNHAQGRILQLRQEGGGPRDQGHPGRSAARRHPADLLPQDHVLDRQGRPALHPAHPLDRGAAGR